MTNQNQTDTNEMVTIEPNTYQIDFYSAEKYQVFNQIFTRTFSKFRSNTNNKFGTEIPNTYLPNWFW